MSNTSSTLLRRLRQLMRSCTRRDTRTHTNKQSHSLVPRPTPFFLFSRRSSASMYYCQRKPNTKNGVGLGTRLQSHTQRHFTTWTNRPCHWWCGCLWFGRKRFNLYQCPYTGLLHCSHRLLGRGETGGHTNHKGICRGVASGLGRGHWWDYRERVGGAHSSCATCRCKWPTQKWVFGTSNWQGRDCRYWWLLLLKRQRGLPLQNGRRRLLLLNGLRRWLLLNGLRWLLMNSLRWLLLNGWRRWLLLDGWRWLNRRWWLLNGGRRLLLLLTGWTTSHKGAAKCGGQIYNRRCSTRLDLHLQQLCCLCWCLTGLTEGHLCRWWWSCGDHSRVPSWGGCGARRGWGSGCCTHSRLQNTLKHLHIINGLQAGYFKWVIIVSFKFPYAHLSKWLDDINPPIPTSSPSSFHLTSWVLGDCTTTICSNRCRCENSGAEGRDDGRVGRRVYCTCWFQFCLSLFCLSSSFHHPGAKTGSLSLGCYWEGPLSPMF